MAEDETQLVPRRLMRNILVLASSQIISRSLGLVLVIVLARYLGPEGYGIYSLAFTYYTIFYFLANVGLDTLVTKDVAKDRSLAAEYTGEVLSLKLLTSVIAIALIGLIVALSNYSLAVKLGILSLSLGIVYTCLSDTLKAVFNANELMQYPSMIEVARSAASLGLILIMVAFKRNVLEVLSAQAFSLLLSLGFAAWIFNRRLLVIKDLRLGLRKGKELLWKSLPFFSVTALFVLNARLDMIMVSWFIGEKGIGYYCAAVELLNIMLVLPMLINNAFFPVLSRVSRSEGGELVEACNNGIKVNVILGVPVAAGLMILAPRVVGLAFGKDYGETVGILRIFCVTLALQYGASLLGWIFTATENIKIVIKVNLLALLLNVALNLVLIPVYGLSGAAISAVLCNVFGGGFMSYMLTKQLPAVGFFRFYVKPLVASSVMVLFVVVFSGLPLAVLVIGGAFLYLVIMVLIGGIRTSEIEKVFSHFRRPTVAAD